MIRYYWIPWFNYNTWCCKLYNAQEIREYWSYSEIF